MTFSARASQRGQRKVALDASVSLWHTIDAKMGENPFPLDKQGSHPGDAVPDQVITCNLTMELG